VQEQNNLLTKDMQYNRTVNE